MYYKLDDNNYLCAFSFDTVLPGGVLYRGRVPEDFNEENFDCWKIEEDTLTFDGGRQRALSEEAADREELAGLLTWFSWYDRQVMEYQRCSRLGQAYDREINKLDQEAIEKQLRIRALRERSGIDADQ
ncbi:hypothetical protein [Emergencia sp.]|uniref:hypothetical protein n=1 Tax=Emergencia sp. TaxID=1926557 RepID=UPI003AEFD1C1